MPLKGHSDDKYRTGTRLSTSADLNWSELLAEKWQHRSGDLTGLTPRETEVAIMLRGDLEVERWGDGQRQKTRAVPGTIWLCPAGIHEDYVHLDGNIDECIHLYIPAEPFTESALRDFDVDPARIQLNYEGGFHDGLIEHIGRAILAEMKNESVASPLLIETLRCALAAHLLRNYSNLSPKLLKLPATAGALGPKKIERIDAFISANIEKNITLDDLANEACLSPCHFARAFKVAIGQTPHNYIIGKKLAFAKSLLLNKDISLSYIAMESGFASQANFTRAFKRIIGMTPREYRKHVCS